MVDSPVGSTVPRRQLGRHLRDRRQLARISLKAAAEALDWSETKLWRIETGQTSVRVRDVAAMCDVYAVDRDTYVALLGLATETKAKGWWHSYGDVIPEYFDLFIGLEEAASELSNYQVDVVPGLFQTADYARAMVRTARPDLKDAEVERRVQVRLARQALLTRRIAPPGLAVVIGEAALRQAVGGPEVMADQLGRLSALCDLRNVSIRVMPFAHGAHSGLAAGPFVMLEFPINDRGTPTEPTTIYIEHLAGTLYLDRPHEVTRYQRAFNELHAAALDEPASKRFISVAAKEWQA
jgi:transcriptional regulator with XRE-family HTH domain